MTASSVPAELPVIPEGVLQGPTVGQVALALNMSSATVKGWLDSGVLPSWRPDPRSWRRVRLDDLALFAGRRGLPVNWEALV